MPVLTRLVLSSAFILAICLTALAQAPAWERYENARFGFRIELPLGQFAPETPSDNGDGISLSEVGGQGQIDVFGSYNVDDSDLGALAALLENSERVREVTYRARGRSWLVLSGYYADQGAGDIIFYAKFMFNADRSAVSALEVSYPRAEKDRYDAIVTRLEKSLSAPA